MRAIAGMRPSVILALGITITFLYAHPGLMTQDSMDLLGEARRGTYTDGHPPVLTALWRIIDALVSGQLGILVIQIILFQLGLYWILRRTFSPRRAAWGSVALFVFPPVFMPMVVIWKDCLMAASLAVGFAAMFAERRGLRIAGLVALMFASAVRYNALGATLPIVILLFQWTPAARPLRRYATATAAWFAITFTAFGLNAALTDHKMHLWYSSLAVYDIVGTLTYLDDDMPDAELEQLFAGSELRVHTNIHAAARGLYTPRDFFPIITGKGDAQPPLWVLPIYGTTPAPAPVRDAIGHAWWELVSGHPLAYVQHRLAVMREVLCLGETTRPLSAVTRRDLVNSDQGRSLGLASEWSWLQRHGSRWMYQIWKHTPLYVPWIYLVLTLILLPLTRRHRDVFALLLSGLMMEGTLLLLAPSPDYRYSHWMVVCTCLAVVALTARRARAARAAAT